MALSSSNHRCARRRIATIATVALVAAISTSCGGGGSGGGKQSAGDFIHEITTQFALGQSGRLWGTLHPADQAVVDRGRYTACESNEGFVLKKFKVLDTYPETIDLAGQSTAATAVSIRATSEDGITTATIHAVSVNGAWRWVLSPADYAAYKRGACPSS